MDLVRDGLADALRRLLSGDPEIWGITARTLQVSGAATLIAIVLGLPAGLWVGLGRIRARRVLLTLLYTGMGLPTVLVGLVLTILFWREGLLGRLEILYTPWAMVAGQAVIAFPFVAGLTASSILAIDPAVRRQVKALGASGPQAAWLLALEARRGIIAAATAGFGAAVSEVGAAMMLGGNLSGSTRVLTTSTILEARMGRFDSAIGLGALLLAITLAVNAALVWLSPRERV